jgi:hypothetical protein
MKTVILQSYRTSDVPAWIVACIASVRAWAGNSGWDYTFMDDGFFSLAPEWARRRCGDNIYAVADLCRLQMIKDALEKGYDRAVWVDADVLIFTPANLDISTSDGHGFAYELFFRLEQGGGYSVQESLNNSVMVFEKGQEVLELYLDASLDTLCQASEGPIPRTALAPALLHKLHPHIKPGCFYGVGLFTLAMMGEIANGGGRLINDYVRAVPAPLGAANLCHFLRNETPVSQRNLFDRIYMLAVDKLMTPDGKVLMQGPTL